LGFAESDVVNFLGGNLMRVFETVWKPAVSGAGHKAVVAA
jgi:hypothetical protein